MCTFLCIVNKCIFSCLKYKSGYILAKMGNYFEKTDRRYFLAYQFSKIRVRNCGDDNEKL